MSSQAPDAASDMPVPSAPWPAPSAEDYPVPPPRPAPVQGAPAPAPAPAAPPPAPAPAAAAASTRKTLVFANDKSSGKTTTANAVLVSLLDRYPMLMRSVAVREYDRQPRLANIFRKEDGLASMAHYDARNAQAYDAARLLAEDPNATPWDDLLFSLGAGSMVVDLGANIFADICRILDDEPRPIFPDGGELIGLVVPVTTAADSIESAIAAIEAGINWGPKVAIFVVEQEYLGRFDGAATEWTSFRDRVAAAEGARFHVVRIEKLQVADIGRVVFQRIDRMVAEAQDMLRSTRLEGADYIRAIRKARAEVAWGSKTLGAVQPIADWFAR
ncbi:MAG: hypothetical protein WDN49_18360 [Acetobacteraceae bacterium]